MSTMTDSFLNTNSNRNMNCFDGCYYDNQYYTDYPSPVSSPTSPEVVEISGNPEDIRINGSSYSSEGSNCYSSPCSPILSDDIDIDIDLDNLNKSNTNMNQYTNNNSSSYVPLSPVDSSQCETPKKFSKKRSFSEVDDTDVFTDLDSMSEEEIDDYLNNIDLDLFPKVKSSSELLIFSPLAMKRFKLTDGKINENKNNYDCFSINDDTNTPRIVEISDDEETSSNLFPTTFNTTSSVYSSNSINSYTASPISSASPYCGCTSSCMSSYQQGSYFDEVTS